MIRILPTLGFAPTAYVLLSWLATLAAAALLFDILMRRKYLLVKPSIIYLAYAHLLFQWPATLFAPYYERFLPDPWALWLLVQGLVLGGLAGSSVSWHREARLVWDRVQEPVEPWGGERRGAMLLLTLACGGIVGVYLAFVPWTSTGLYAVITDPVRAGLAREESLKLLDVPGLGYAFQFMATAFAPLLIAMLVLVIGGAWRRRRPGAVLGALAMVALLMAAMSLTGARAYAVNAFLVVVWCVLLVRGVPVRPVGLVVAAIVVLAPAVLLSVLREGGAEGVSDVLVRVFVQSILRRAFIDPLDVGSWYVHYAQVEGPFGLAGFERLATLLGAQSVTPGNVIGLQYEPYTLESVNAGAGFPFMFYGYMGIGGFPLALIATWGLDLILPILSRVRTSLTLPAVACVAVTLLAFISADYTVGWLTHGFGVVVAAVWVIDRFLGWERTAWVALVSPTAPRGGPSHRAGPSTPGGPSRAPHG